MPFFDIRLETERQYLRPLSYEELLLYINSPSEFALVHQLNDNHTIPDVELNQAVYNEFYPVMKNPHKEYIFYTLWLIIRKTDSEILGTIYFHGEPENGKVEIGYGIYEHNCNCGYMTESIRQLIEWTRKRSDIELVFAETDKQNTASQKVLIKTGFSAINSDNESILWQLNVKNEK